MLLVETIRKAGPDRAISGALWPWRRPRAVHNPGKILLDVALAVALGGDCLADVGILRAESAVFGLVVLAFLSRSGDIAGISNIKVYRLRTSVIQLN